MFAKKGLSAAPAAVPQYVEEVFSTYLYTGDGSGFSVNNGIDLSGEGGMVWLKDRTAANLHMLFDTNRGATYFLRSTGTDAQAQGNATLTAFNNNGFTIGDSSQINTASNRYASWTFRKAEKFFDVQTWTGTGTSGRQVAHNLGSVPGCVIIKCTSTAGEPWYVYHRSVGASGNLLLNTTDAASSPASEPFDGVAPTSTYITLPSYSGVNGSGKTYVGYFFAHDAGGFGDAGDQSVIKCGSFTASNGLAVSLGYEPQFVMLKASSTTGNWLIMDNMRGMPVGGNESLLRPNTADAETASLNIIDPTATGFTVIDGGGLVMGATYVYIAIRRGPMKTPEAGTEVYNGIVRTGTAAAASVTSIGFAPDLVIGKARTKTYSPSFIFTDKLRGYNAQLASTSTAAESTDTTGITGWLNNGYTVGADGSLGGYNLSTDSNDYIHWPFRRAPGFFDVVCYTGNASTNTISHNLGTTPIAAIVKRRNSTGNWKLIAPSLFTGTINLQDYTDTPSGTNLFTFSSSNISTTSTNTDVNASGGQYVAYLFGDAPGVIKVGTYTGTGATQTINCGFTNGARFVLVRKTSASDASLRTAVFDTARGIVANSDPYIRIDSTAVEVTGTDYVDPDSTGFAVTSSSVINASGATYFYLAIA